MYEGGDVVLNDALGIAFFGFIGYLVTVVLEHSIMADGPAFMGYLKYIVLVAFFVIAYVYWMAKKAKRA